MKLVKFVVCSNQTGYALAKYYGDNLLSIRNE